MSVVKASGLLGLFSRGQTEPVAVLIHGADRSAVYDLCKELITHVTGSTADSLGLVRLTEQQLATSKERLFGEFASVSMFGGRQAVWISGASDSVASALDGVLASETPGNLIVIDAENLAKTSRLRKLCEASPRCASLALYEESPQELRRRLLGLIKAEGFSIADDAMEKFMELVSVERAVGESEARKLLIYCHGKTKIELDDVNAICGDTSEASADDLVDAVFGGNLLETDRFGANLAEGRGVLSVALQHVAKLQAMAALVSPATSIDSVVNSPRFGIFFKRRPAVAAQLGVWSIEALLGAEEKICSAILQTRQFPDLGEAISSRTLLALSRSAHLR